MCEMPFFSVIVPAYNVGEYIGNTIQSILGQTEQGFELLLINDGSEDSTPEVCLACARAHPGKVRYLTGRHYGVSHARNRGIRAAKGKYIVFSDGDDYMARTALARMRGVLEKDRADVLYCDIKATDSLTEEEPDEERPAERIGRKACCISKLQEKMIPANAACFRKSFLEKEGILFDEEQFFAEDALFFFTCIEKAETILHMPSVVYYYVRREGSTTQDMRHILKIIGNEIHSWKKIKRTLSRDREIDAYLLPRIRRIRKGYLICIPGTVKNALVHLGRSEK